MAVFSSPALRTNARESSRLLDALAIIETWLSGAGIYDDFAVRATEPLAAATLVLVWSSVLTGPSIGTREVSFTVVQI